jgi:hypothetical protein
MLGPLGTLLRPLHLLAQPLDRLQQHRTLAILLLLERRERRAKRGHVPRYVARRVARCVLRLDPVERDEYPDRPAIVLLASPMTPEAQPRR